MREFFKGWRRKAGCVTLVMAAAFTAAWFRSQFYWDYVSVAFRGADYSIWSDNEALTISRVWYSEPMAFVPVQWDTGNIENYLPNKFFELKDAYVSGPYGTTRLQELVISHLSIAISLTLLSACLIVWPGKRVTKPTPSTCGEHGPR